MRAYHIALYPVESEVAFGISLRSRRVDEAVKAVAFIRHMPVVKKVIVQERAAHERALVHTEGQLFRYAHAQPCNAERMLVYADSAVLDELPLPAHAVGCKNISAVPHYNAVGILFHPHVIASGADVTRRPHL